MSWEKEVEELRQRRELAQQMGGPEKVERQHHFGKLTVRERINALLDPGSFREVGSISGVGEYDAGNNLTTLTAANFIHGRGKVDGRDVVVGGDDFTIRGGSSDASIPEKQIQAERMAAELRLPIIRLCDGTGGGGSVKSLEKDGRTYIPANPGWDLIVDNLSRVPVVGLGLGSVAGLGAARLVSTHYSVMVRDISYMFIAGPPIVARTGRVLTKDELGGVGVHTAAGSIDDVADSEEEAFQKVRQFLSYLPSSVYELAERAECEDDPERRDEMLLSVVPRDRRKTYDMRRIIKAVVDSGTFFEMGKAYGKSVITGLARLDGWPVAVLGSNPNFYGGCWTADAARKVERFVDLANTFHLPVVHLVDIPGFLIGPESEAAGTIRHGARAQAAVYQAKVPWCSIIIRKCFGVAGSAHSNHTRLRYRYAWPSADWGSLPIEGGIEAAYRAELDASEDPEATMAEIEARLNAIRTPFRSAEAFLIEEMVDPRDTRPLLCEFARLAAKVREPGEVANGMRP